MSNKKTTAQQIAERYDQLRQENYDYWSTMTWRADRIGAYARQMMEQEKAIKRLDQMIDNDEAPQ